MKKLLLFAVTAMAMLAALPSRAATATLDDLVGWKVAMVLYGSKAQDCAPIGVFEGEITKTESGTVTYYYLTNFLGTGDKIRLVVQSNKYVNVGNTASGSNYVWTSKTSLQRAKTTDNGDGSYTYAKNTSNMIPQLMDLAQVTISNNYYTKVAASNPMIVTINGTKYCSEGWFLTFYNPTTEITPAEGEPYMGLWTGKGMYNYGDIPVFYDYARINNTGGYFLPSPFAISIGTGSNFPGTISPQAVSFSMEQDIKVVSTDEVIVTKVEGATAKQQYISGAQNLGEIAQLSCNPYNLTWAPNTSHHNWAYCSSGSTTTSTTDTGLKTKSVMMQVPEMALYDFDTKEVIRTIEPASYNYQITSGNYIVAPEASVNITKFGYDTTNGTLICGSIIPGQYADLVESWELYVLPDKSKLNGRDMSKLWESLEVPATGAIKLDSQYDYPMPEMVDASNEGVEEGDNDGSIKFAKLIPASVLPDKYTYYNFFVGMKLRSDKVTTGADQPMFNGIGSYMFEITTGIDDVNAGQVNVSAGSGCINISGADGSVDIFNMQGQRIYAGNDSSVPVAPGLYIVKVGEKASKLIVK